MYLSTETSISEYSLLSTPTLTVRFHLRLQCLLNCAMMHAGSTWAWQSPREEGSGMSRGGEIKIVPVCLFATPTSQRPPTGHCQKHLSSVQAGNCWWIVLQNRIFWHLKYLPSDNAASVFTKASWHSRTIWLQAAYTSIHSSGAGFLNWGPGVIFLFEPQLSKRWNLRPWAFLQTHKYFSPFSRSVNSCEGQSILVRPNLVC